jgi:deoxyhypusine synthase
MSTQPNNAPPTSVTDAVLVASEPVPEGTHKVSGVDFEKYQGRDITVAEMVDNMKYMGFQSSAVADAARIINEMVSSYPGPSCVCWHY